MPLVITLNHKDYPAILDGFDPADPDHLIRTGTIAFDNSYLTGGEALNPVDLGLSSIDVLVCSPFNGFQFEYVYASATTGFLRALVGDNAGAVGPFIQSISAFDLSALTAVRFFAIGKIARAA